MSNHQGGNHEVPRLDRSDRVLAGPDRNDDCSGSISGTEGQAAAGADDVLGKGVLSFWTTGAGSGDPYIDAMAAVVAERLTEELREQTGRDDLTAVWDDRPIQVYP